LLQITVLRPWYSQIWFKVLLSDILLSLAVYLVLRLVRKKMKKMEQQMRAMNSVFMNKLDSFIEDNISNSSLDIAMITSNMTMSRASLYNKVKEITGKGIWEYIEDIRIKKACKLLRETPLPIAEIAEQCGFGSSHYFSTRFKKLCSCTPREYRHNNSSK
ncbi:MAG: helix-turn-helix domain-containing protein, partial [Candidatus Cryptobacteroides sp.]